MSLKKKVDLTVEHSLGMGHSSIISNNATSDGAFQNEACKYYEVDQMVFEETLVPRGKDSGRLLPPSESQRHEDPEPESIHHPIV